MELCVSLLLMVSWLPSEGLFDFLPPPLPLSHRDPLKKFLDSESAIRLQGNYTIGGLFSAFTEFDSENRTCSAFNVPGLLYIQAMIYAVEQANQGSVGFLYRREKLGYHIVNDCYNIDRAMEASLQFLMGKDPKTRMKWVSKRKSFDDKQGPDVLFAQASPVVAVVGAASSDISAAVSSLYSVNMLPLISYSATSPKLSDKTKYPSFFRTIPPDGAQVTAMADLIDHFNWTWISAIATDDSYGRYGMQLLKEVLNSRGVCLACEELIDARLTNESMEKALYKLTNGEMNNRAKVVVFICSGAKVDPFLKLVKAKNMTDRIWLASESWGYGVFLPKYEQVLSGALGIATDDEFPKDFYDYLMELPFRKINRWFQQYLNSEALSHHVGIWPMNSSSPLRNHPAAPRLDVNLWKVWFSQVPRVLNAVHSVAKALKTALKHRDKYRTSRVIYPYKIMQYLHKLEFEDFGHGFSDPNATFRFDRNGDVAGGYKINSLKHNSDFNLLEFKQVGSWNGLNWTIDNPMRPQEAETEKVRLLMNDTLILWKNNSTEVPPSCCRDPCLPGTYRIYSGMRCCWSCSPCAQGKFCAKRDATKCKDCPKGMTSNSDRSGCKYIEDYVEWKSVPELTVLFLAALGQLGVIGVTFVFVKHSKSPIVVCSNRVLNFSLLVLLFVGFSLPFLFLIRPNPVLCSFEAILFGFVFSTITGILLVKTRHVLVIFERTIADPMVRRRELWQCGGLAVLSLAVAVPYLIVNPPVPLPYSAECGVRWTIIQQVNMAYIIILSVVTTAVAFRARNLPENYNETGTISTLMLLLLLVWVACLPSYYRAFVMQRTLLLCLAIDAASYLILLLLFGSKVYIIFWEPHKNTKAFVARMNMIHIWKKYNRAQKRRDKRRQSETTEKSTVSSMNDKFHNPREHQLPIDDVTLTAFTHIQ